MMAKNNLIEYDDTKNDQYFYLQKLSSTSNSIYNFLIITIIITFCFLPFIYVDVTSTAGVVIQSRQLKENIYSPSTGKITKFTIEKNRFVSKGDTIFTLDNSSVNNELESLRMKEKIVVENIHDITAIKKLSSNSPAPLLYTSQFQAQYLKFVEEKSQLLAKYENVTKSYNRNTKLLKEKIISVVDYESFELAYEQAKLDLELHTTKFLSSLQTENYQFNQELINLRAKKNQLHEVFKNSYVIANISGTGYQTDGIQVGSFLQMGQKIAEIMPDSGLIAYCYVSPKDIGFIKSGQKVKIQIDSFNYSDWGMLSGSVTEIYKDVDIIEGHAFYLVYCKIDRPFLLLKSGYKGSIIKGMSGRANFVLTERTLWQILFAKANDWLNPKTI